MAHSNNSREAAVLAVVNGKSDRQSRDSGQTASAADRTGPGQVSPWLYLAGLIVTLSGLYAVNYGREDPGFAASTYIVATLGYGLTYTLRTFRVQYESIRMPVLVLIALGIFFWLSSGQSEPTGDGRSIIKDGSHALQILCVWLALLQPFAAVTDMAVLASCVPCMSLIALVSTTSLDTEVQYSFLVFIAAATFLMVHENYLRTRSQMSQSDSSRTERKLFGGQVQLAAACVVGAFLLANVVAIPMHVFGRSLSLASGWGQGSPLAATFSNVMAGSAASDDTTLYISTGPISESDAPVMRVESAQRLNLRGSTFDFYTGSSFQNRIPTKYRLSAQDETSDLQVFQHSEHAGDLGTDSEVRQYQIRSTEQEPTPISMKGHRKIVEKVTTLVPGEKQCYAGGAMIAVAIARDQELEATYSGSLLAVVWFPQNAQYRIAAIAPTDDETLIRAQCSRSKEIPVAISTRYLQVAHGSTVENEYLRQLAGTLTAGIANSYDKAVAIRDYISKNCAYNLQAKAAPTDSDRVEYFLRVSHEGYCDSFAAAMTMLCRYADIPSRVASGYLPGKEDGKGGSIVRNLDKHAWSEVFFAGVGWVPFDATEGSTDISDHSKHQQTEKPNFMAWLTSHGPVPLLIVIALVGLLIYVVLTELPPRLKSRQVASDRTGRPPTNTAIVQAYMQAVESLSKRGLERTRSATPNEYVASVIPKLSSVVPQAAEAFIALTVLHDRARYGRETASDAEALQAQTLTATIKNTLARVPRKALLSLVTAPQA